MGTFLKLGEKVRSSIGRAMKNADTPKNWTSLRDLAQQTIFGAVQRVLGSSPAPRVLVNKCLWYALVYHSKAYGKLVSNYFVPYVNNSDKRREVEKRRDSLFYWYERKAEMGDLLSFFDMALEPAGPSWDPPVIGMVRGLEAYTRERGTLVNISNLVVPEVLSHYRDQIPARGSREKGWPRAMYPLVDEVVEHCVHLLLEVRHCRAVCRKIKRRFAIMLGKPDIYKADDANLLRGLLCFLLSDDLWRYYYYFPYWRSKGRPFAAFGIATNRALKRKEIQDIRSHLLPGMFERLGLVEDTLRDDFHEKKVRFQERFVDSQGAKNLDVPDILHHWAKEVIRAEGGVGKIADKPWVFPNGLIRRGSVLSTPVEGKGGLEGYVSIWRARDGEPLKGADEAEVANLSRRVSDVVLRARSVDKPPVAWLSIDIRGSRNMKDRFLPWQVWTAINEFHRWIDRLLIVNYVDRYESTPDGYMCGFYACDHAVWAAKAVLADRGNFNKMLLEKGGAAPVKLRLGVQCGKVEIFGDLQKKGVRELVGKVLDEAGHLQKEARVNEVLISDTAYRDLAEKTTAGFVRRKAGRGRFLRWGYQFNDKAGNG